MAKKTTEIAKTDENAAAIIEMTPNQRFTGKVIQEFSTLSGNELELTNFQRKLMSNYFIKLDSVLKEAEMKRMKKGEQYRDAVSVEWKNVNIEKLAQDVVAFTSIGLDPMEPNHISLIPYKNNGTGKYDITCMMGYKGIELKAKKYGLDVPDSVIIELVYSTDKFKSKKKSFDNPIESYELEITNDFDRGEVVGGFYYHMFNENPTKNKLKLMSLKDILKRKPDYAAAEFWGGEKDKWENGKKVGKETTEGWSTEMYEKTLHRAAYNAITIDSEKIDVHFQRTIEQDISHDAVKNKVNTEIEQKANKEPLVFEEAQEVIEEAPQPVSVAQTSMLDAIDDVEPPFAKKD